MAFPNPEIPERFQAMDLKITRWRSNTPACLCRRTVSSTSFADDYAVFNLEWPYSHNRRPHGKSSL